VLFERGAFTAIDSSATALALGIYGAGLPAFVLVKALTPGYYAREDTATPFRFAVISMVVNTILSAALFLVIGFAGIALATVLASWLNIGMLAWRLHQRGHFAADQRLRRRLPRIIASSVAMGLVVWAAGRWLAPLLVGPLLVKGAALAALVFGGLAVFGVAALLCGAVSLGDFRRAVGRA
jgi:putative peptidoglycan lipid II flippase